MQTLKTRSHKLTATVVVFAVRPEILLALSIQTAIEENPNYLIENPGVIAMIRTLDLDEKFLGKTVVNAMETAGQLDGHTKQRVQEAEKYIRNVAMFLSPAGRAWGIFLNSALANVRPDDFKQNQAKIFGDEKQVKPLITLNGITQFINAMTRTEIQVDGNQQKTVAQLALENVTSFGSPDNNVIAAILPTAIRSKGQLDQNTFVQVARGLRTEGANPSQAVPRTVIDDATQYQETHGYHDGQNGKRTERQPRA